jgi:peptidoglycan/xylan/chitin deacetylase (PgdA/CDA1 family)
MMLSKERQRRIISQGCAQIPFSFLEKLTGTKVIIVYYHIVNDENVPHVRHLHPIKNTKEFREDLDFLLGTFSPMGLTELLNDIKSGRFLLTFDDGYREVSDVIAPILLEKGITATFFVNSAFVDNKELCYTNKASLIVDEFLKCRTSGLKQALDKIQHVNNDCVDNIASRVISIKYEQRSFLDEIANMMGISFSDYLRVNKPYLTSDQINRLIQSGFTIGAHSIDHPMYQSLSLEDQVYQTLESVRFVRDSFHLNYGVFAFPFSDHDISKEFFERVSHSKSVDLTFGTAGLMEDSAPNHLQRFSLERPIDTAERIIAFQLARRLTRSITRTAKIVRV